MVLARWKLTCQSSQWLERKDDQSQRKLAENPENSDEMTKYFIATKTIEMGGKLM
jgi:hypothetical protein